MLRIPRLLACAVVLGALSQSACFAWQYDTDPVPVVMARKPNRVWVPVGADSSVILIAGQVVNDSLVGLIEGSAEPAEQLKRFSAPLAEVPRVARERLTFWVGAQRAGIAAGHGVEPVGIYLGQLVLLSALVLGTIGFGAYIRGAGH